MSNLPPAWAMPPSTGNEAEQRPPPPQQQQQQPPPSYQQQPPYQTNQSMVNMGNPSGPPPPSVTPPPTVSAAVASSAQAMPKSRLEQRMESKILSCRTPDQETEQGLVRNEEAIRKIRDSWIYKNIRARTNEFTEFKQVRNEKEKEINLTILTKMIL